MLADKHLRVVRFFQKSTDVFPLVDIKGGVVITFRDSGSDIGPIGFFSPYDELRSVLRKVQAHKEFKKGEFVNLISYRGMYRFSSTFFAENPQMRRALSGGTGNMITSNAFELCREVFWEDKPTDGRDYVRLFGRCDGHRVYRWIDRRYVIPNEYLDTYNVLVPQANGTGAIGEVLSTPIIGQPIIGQPIIGHTDTFISVGKFKTQSEAEGCYRYICTKFARTMLGTLKVTQNTPRDAWTNVPMQDFSAASDIDWSAPIADIDRQLYRKYGFSDAEVAFVEAKVRAME